MLLFGILCKPVRKWKYVDIEVTIHVYSIDFFVISINISLFFFSVGIFKDGYVEIIPNDQRKQKTASCVAFKDNGERIFGDSAGNQLTSNPTNTIFNVKRFIGRKWDDPIVQNSCSATPITLLKTITSHMFKFLLAVK